MDATPAAPEIKEAERQIARIPLVLNRRNFSWLTERISGVVEQPAPRWWWVAFTITASAATFGLFCLGYQISTGVGTWVGLGHHQLRFLDRYRTRRHAHIRDLIFAPPKMAYFD